MSRIALLLSLSLPALALPAAARAGDWRRPVDGHVLRVFALAADPYARGQHRGVDLEAPPGTRVRSACAGRVSFAGSVPRRGRTLSVRCGALVASYQGLAAIGVRRGARVARGTSLGSVGRSRDPRTRRPHLHLGVRELASGRYVDPLTLVGDGRPAPPLLPPGRRPRPWQTPPGGPSRVPLPTPRLVPARGFAPAQRAGMAPPTPPKPLHPDARPYVAPVVPWVVWVGLAAVGLALPFSGFVGLRRHRRIAARRATGAPRRA